jgi:peptidoglycan lytic transglycosylase
MRYRAVIGLCAAALALAGCGVFSGKGESNTPAPNQNGYYKVGNPYQIDGAWYYPSVDWNYDQTGTASWYGPDFHGKYTANGEIFDMNALTAAHRTLPMPSIVQVTNLENGRSIQLRINDRGPYAKNRIIDVSRRAAQLLGFENTGTAQVEVKLLRQETMAAQSLAQKNGGEDAPPAPHLAALPLTPVSEESLAPPPGTQAAPQPASAAQATMQPIPDPQPRSASKLVLVQRAEAATAPQANAVPAGARIYIQAGAFARQVNAEQLKQKLAALGHIDITAVRVNGVSLYRVRIGPVKTAAEADKLLARVIGQGAPGARIAYE